ncbi:MAG: CinA family protein [Bdellovibrionota bacterium]|jgi:PncC family amidohydrolase
MEQNFYTPMECGFSQDLIKETHTLLLKSELSLGFAESCSGGLLSNLIVSEVGASKYFKGGIVSYCNEVKKKILNVSEDVLKNYGAVSVQCAEQMALGARGVLDADIAFSVTGLAGPDGGTKDKRVGTVCIGFSSEGSTYAKSYFFEGDRTKIRFLSAYTVLNTLKIFLLNDNICTA